jgi:hypothetical protein
MRWWVLVALLWPALAGAATVTLAWDYTDNPERPASGFNLYRQIDCLGDFLPVNGIMLPLTPRTYTETSLSPGTTYCWIVKAVDGTEPDSDPSNTVQVTIPALARNLAGGVITQ